jgi:hypothetical protein
MSMFTWLNKQGVQSDRGFIVQRTGRFTAEYREHGKVVTLDVESGLDGGLPCIILDPSVFEHWDGESAQISPSQQEQMFLNFKEAVEFQGLKMVVEKGVGP